MGNDEMKNQWHAPFCSAMRLEFLMEGKRLEFNNEYNLSSKPLQVDLLIISKKMRKEIKNEIGKLFRRHNLIEYKSPGAALNEDTYYKVLAYACLYKALREKPGKIEEGEITITFIREGYPKTLMEYFTDHGFLVKKPGKGIYHILKEYHFPMQVIVSKELDKKEHVWLTSLTKKLSEARAEKLVLEADALKGEYARAHAEAVLNLSMNVNEDIFNKMKDKEEYAVCCEAIRKFFQPELDEKERIISEKDQALNEMDQIISEKESIIAKNTQEVVNKDKKMLMVVENLMEQLKCSLAEACKFALISTEEYQQLKENELLMKKTA